MRGNVLQWFSGFHFLEGILKKRDDPFVNCVSTVIFVYNNPHFQSECSP